MYSHIFDVLAPISRISQILHNRIIFECIPLKLIVIRSPLVYVLPFDQFHLIAWSIFLNLYTTILLCKYAVNIAHKTFFTSYLSTFVLKRGSVALSLYVVYDIYIFYVIQLIIHFSPGNENKQRKCIERCIFAGNQSTFHASTSFTPIPGNMKEMHRRLAALKWMTANVYEAIDFNQWKGGRTQQYILHVRGFNVIFFSLVYTSATIILGDI